jgi:hypothetical protein
MEWTHAQCEPCWDERNPGRIAHRSLAAQNREPETCCFCGGLTYAGIFVRHDPRDRAGLPFCVHQEPAA